MDEAGAWGSDDKNCFAEKPIVYIEELLVEEPWQHKGIGTWTLPALFETDFVRNLGSTYLITWPSVINPYYKDAPESRAEWTAQDNERYVAKCEQIVAFYRIVGFRRLGTTRFFMMAKSSQHPSRLVHPEHDLPFQQKKCSKKSKYRA